MNSLLQRLTVLALAERDCGKRRIIRTEEEIYTMRQVNFIFHSNYYFPTSHDSLVKASCYCYLALLEVPKFFSFSNPPKRSIKEKPEVNLLQSKVIPIWIY